MTSEYTSELNVTRGLSSFSHEPFVFIDYPLYRVSFEDRFWADGEPPEGHDACVEIIDGRDEANEIDWLREGF